MRVESSAQTPSFRATTAQVVRCPEKRGNSRLPWQRCTVHFVRDMHQHCRPSQRSLVSAALREVFNAEDQAQARERVTHVIDQLAPTVPKVAELLAEAEEDLLAFYAFAREHWTKLRSTNPLERVNREIGRRTDVVGIFPNDASLIRLAGMLLIEQNDCHEGRQHHPS